ncbi:hypothetical protein DCS_06226 [Drechmeria coniospora]|uniref:Carrier domain-containing protein n=1 Tax=Drechmeria coniospora TaxID=98403 RepID=A0A151GAZ1_DRECN|nr:hypothetical protein DCS_06226 [Drechmeria coniospora]KYK54269.1 hypothetical protein DCS_06226 [Drechmeria coniospora]
MSQLRALYAGLGPSRVSRSLPSRSNAGRSSVETSPSLQKWRRKLSGAKPCIFPRLALHPAARRETQGFDLDINTERFSQFCTSHQFEPSTVIRIAWALVLRTFVGTDMVTFGFQLSGRAQPLLPDASQAVGSFAAFLPFLADFSKTKSLLEHLQDADEMTREDDDGDLPTMTEIEHELCSHGEPLFNTCVSFHDATKTIQESFDKHRNVDIDAWKPSIVSSSQVANCKVSVSVTLLDNRIHADIGYQHLAPDQAHNIFNSFERALQVILCMPSQFVSQIDMFTDRDYQQTTTPDWDPNQTDTKVSACINDLIVHQARQQPYATAVSAWDGDFSYQQVEAFATKLATYLVNLGVGPGELVPLVLEKSRWAPVMMLGVLQAGGCFVGLDSQDPAMVEATIKQLDPSLVLVAESAWTHVSHVTRNCILVYEGFLDSLPPQLAVMVEKPIPEQAAVAFLPAAQKKPKGVFFTHQALCSIMSMQGPALRIGNRSRVLQLSAYNVDIALVEILGTLLHGGCVCIPSAQEKMNDLEGVIARMDVTWTYMTPVLARKVDPSMVPNLKTICFRTRSLDDETFTPWLHNREVLLAYGSPDVCPMALSVLKITAPDETSIIAPPLMGRFLILNPDDPKKMVPVGAAGELAIDSPLITPHKFIPGQPLVDPAYLFEQNKGKWRYLRTGHRARCLDRGHVRFLANIRDEDSKPTSAVATAHVEHRIRQCLPRCVDVVVEYVTTSDSVRLLAAFLDLGEGPSCDPYNLNRLSPDTKVRLIRIRRAVETSLAKPDGRGRKLPWQSIPAVFVPVRGFPLSVSLKVNRRKLQRLVASRTCSQLVGLADDQGACWQQQQVVHSWQPLEFKPLPLTRTEEAMCYLWAGVLGTEAVNIRPTDSFFDAGGSRALAVRLVVACRKVGYTISIQDILRGGSLTELCRSTADTEKTTESKLRGKIHAKKASINNRKQSLGADHGFIKLVLAPQIEIPWHDVMDAAEATSQQVQHLESSLYQPRADINCLLFDFNGPVSLPRLRAACEALTGMHHILRTAFAVHERHVYQVTIKSFRPEFNHQRCSSRSLDLCVNQAVAESQALPVRLGQPVTKFTFLEADQQCKLMMRYSTAQISVTAMPQIVKDLIKLYSYSQEEEPRRPSFLEYARLMQGTNVEDQVKHWRARLEGASLTQVVPHSKPCGPAADRETLHETVDVLSLSEFGLGFDTVLKTAWAMVLATLSGATDVVFGELVEGWRVRLEAGMDVSSVVGPMENTIPVRVCFPAAPTSPLQAMHNIQRECASSLPFESLGAQMIVKLCTDWPNWSRFSTVVRHRPQALIDGSTINMENTTFTYSIVEPAAQDIPDILVSSTMISSDKVALALQYSESRVPGDYIETAMGLLIGALKTLTCRKTLRLHVFPPAGEYGSVVPWVVLKGGDTIEPLSIADDPSIADWLPKEHRSVLQGYLSSAWNEVLSPASLRLQAEQVHLTRFYDTSGSLMPAYLIADRINRGLRRLDIGGLDMVRVAPDEIIRHPTMGGQMDLVIAKMRSIGIVPNTTPAHRRTMSSPTTTMSLVSRAPQASWVPLVGSVKAAAGFRRHLRDGGGSADGMRDLGAKAGGWMRHHVNNLGNRDKCAAQSVPKPIWPGVGDGGSLGMLPELAELDTDLVSPLSAFGRTGSDEEGSGSTSPAVSPMRSLVDMGLISEMET